MKNGFINTISVLQFDQKCENIIYIYNILRTKWNYGINKYIKVLLNFKTINAILKINKDSQKCLKI